MKSERAEQADGRLSRSDRCGSRLWRSSVEVANASALNRWMGFLHTIRHASSSRHDLRSGRSGRPAKLVTPHSAYATTTALSSPLIHFFKLSASTTMIFYRFYPTNHTDEPSLRSIVKPAVSAFSPLRFAPSTRRTEHSRGDSLHGKRIA